MSRASEVAEAVQTYCDSEGLILNPALLKRITILALEAATPLPPPEPVKKEVKEVSVTEPAIKEKKPPLQMPKIANLNISKNHPISFSPDYSNIEYVAGNSYNQSLYSSTLSTQGKWLYPAVVSVGIGEAYVKNGIAAHAGELKLLTAGPVVFSQMMLQNSENVVAEQKKALDVLTHELMEIAIKEQLSIIQAPWIKVIKNEMMGTVEYTAEAQCIKWPKQAG